MALVPASTARRLAIVGLAFAVSACGGSLVEPEDFVGVGGQVVAGGAGTGAVSPDGSVGVPVDGAAPGEPGAVATQAAGQPTGGSSSAGSGAGSAAGGGAAAAPGVKAASCAGFKNGTGITDSTITIGTIADRSGAVADTFKSAHDAMNAYVAYFNSTSSICGRKLKLQTYDSGLSATGSNDSSKSACSAAFALVGSFSAFDSGGAEVTRACGQPDLRASAVERSRQKASTTVQVSPIDTDHIFLQPWVWAKQKFGAGTIGNSAFVYLNAGASGTIANAIIKGTTQKLGYNWKETIVVDIAGVPNWNAYANQLKAAGIKFVQTNLADFTVKLRSAFKQADYNPVFMADGSFYGPKYIQGSNAQIMDGAYAFTQTAMVEEAARIPELQLMQAWIQRTGGDPVNITAMQAWAAGRLFVQTALELGGKLSRPSLLAALRKVRKYDGNGVITPTDPGGGSTAPCATVVQVKSGKFVRITPYPYTCGPLA